MAKPIGHNEALVLAVLTKPTVITEVCRLLEAENIEDGAVYLALRRLVERGLVYRRTVTREAADRKMRDVGEYSPTPEAREALLVYQRDVERVIRRIGAQVTT
jgi:predicted transcriptional regulator